MCAGRSLNKDDKYNQDAFDLLTKSIKLNPNLIESWIELAECYQKKADFDGAITCLESALKNCDKPDKVVLRNLSACIRQKLVDSQEARIVGLLKSLELSKEALKLDLKDPLSYYNLAKAYLCLFFASECVDDSLIRMSRSAFEKVISTENSESSEKPIVGNSTEHSKDRSSSTEDTTKPLKEQSDFLFNYSTVLVYMQDFQLAVNLLEDASNIEPNWNQPKELLESLEDYLRQINLTLTDLTKNIKKSSRRYKKVVDTLANVSQIEKDIILDEQRLRKLTSMILKTTSIKELVNEKNTPQITRQSTSNVEDPVSINILHIKLLFTINYNQAMYLTFIAIDKDFSFTVVTIHNLSAQNSPSNRDVFTIVEPKIDTVEVNFRKSKECISYNRINVKQFKDFYINGKRISLEHVAKPQIKVSMMADQPK